MDWLQELIIGLVVAIVGGVVVWWITNRRARGGITITATDDAAVRMHDDHSKRVSIQLTQNVQNVQAAPAVPTSSGGGRESDQGALLIVGPLVGIGLFTIVAPVAGAILLIAAGALVLLAGSVAFVRTVRRTRVDPPGLAIVAAVVPLVGAAATGLVLATTGPGGVRLVDRIAAILAARGLDETASLADRIVARFAAGPAMWGDVAAAGIGFVAGLGLLWHAVPLVLAYLVLQFVSDARGTRSASRLLAPLATASWGYVVVALLLSAVGLGFAVFGLSWVPILNLAT